MRGNTFAVVFLHFFWRRCISSTFSLQRWPVNFRRNDNKHTVRRKVACVAPPSVTGVCHRNARRTEIVVDDKSSYCFFFSACCRASCDCSAKVNGGRGRGMMHPTTLQCTTSRGRCSCWSSMRRWITWVVIVNRTLENENRRLRVAADDIKGADDTKAKRLAARGRRITLLTPSFNTKNRCIVDIRRRRRTNKPIT